MFYQVAGSLPPAVVQPVENEIVHDVVQIFRVAVDDYPADTPRFGDFDGLDSRSNFRRTFRRVVPIVQRFTDIPVT